MTNNNHNTPKYSAEYISAIDLRRQKILANLLAKHENVWRDVALDLADQIDAHPIAESLLVECGQDYRLVAMHLCHMLATAEYNADTVKGART